jgi:2-dehydro-3-deoxy-L-rhamnonate dehydrogenase (NAD+)
LVRRETGCAALIGGMFRLANRAAALVAWLSSAECSFTTGGVFDLSGGRATY